MKLEPESVQTHTPSMRDASGSSEMTGPFFSVVIPTHNRAEFLREAMQSVLNQTFGNFEVIVVDDHSEDHTRDVVGSFSDQRIQYVRNDRGKGGAGARNAGIFRAKGEWVAFLDDDDVWLPERLGLQYHKIQEKGQGVGLIYCGCVTYDPKNNRQFPTSIPSIEGWVENALFSRNFIGSFSKVTIRRELLWHVGGLDERFPALQDLELYIRIATLSQVSFVKGCSVYIRRAHVDRISRKLDKKLEASLLLRQKYDDRIRRSVSLRHYAAAKVFIYAVVTGNIGEAVRSFPWTLAGIVLNPLGLIQKFRKMLSIALRERRRRNSPGGGGG